MIINNLNRPKGAGSTLIQKLTKKLPKIFFSPRHSLPNPALREGRGKGTVAISRQTVAVPCEETATRQKKILITIFLFIFLIQLAGVIFLLAVPEASQAGVNFTPQVGIGDDFKKGVAQEVGGSTSMIAEYIKAIYKYALGIVGILATVVLMFGGVLWIIAGGNAERITNAKSWITAALTGLVLALTSYMILYIVNPGLVNFRITPVGPVKDSGSTDKKCCFIEVIGPIDTSIITPGLEYLCEDYCCTELVSYDVCKFKFEESKRDACGVMTFEWGEDCDDGTNTCSVEPVE